MKTLHLILKKKWFDMISSGEKKEEYRDITGFWETRLKWKTQGIDKFDTVTFQLGYQKNAPRVVLKYEGIVKGLGRSDWGAEHGKQYFVIVLGEIIKNNQNLEI